MNSSVQQVSESEKQEERVKKNLTITLLFIIGLIVILLLTLVSIFPQIITTYSIEETLGVYTGSWSLPSEDHPLGTAMFGRDVLALLVYGIRTSIIIGIIITVFSLTGGLLFWYLDNLQSWIRNAIIGIIVILIIAVFWFVQIILGFNSVFSEILVLGTLFMFISYFLVFKKKTKLNIVMKEFLKFLPLMLLIIIGIVEFQEFLGNNDSLIHLGKQISEARAFISQNPLALISPVTTLLIMLLGLFFVHLGFKSRIPME